MSKKANPALVGAFVLGAIVLSVLGLILFGSGKFLEKKYTCVTFFDESIAGLDVGAPVEFQGVRIGTVSDVRIVLDEEDLGSIKRPVTIQIEESRIVYVGESAASEKWAKSDNVGMEKLVTERGLRARLGTQSMLTGKLKIELGYFPKSKDTRKKKEINGVWVLPTIPTALHNIGKQIAELPLKDIVLEVHHAMKGIADLITSAETAGSISNLNATLAGMTTLMASVNQKVDPLMSKTTATIDTANSTLIEIQELIQKMDNEVKPFLTSLTQTSEKVGLMMDEQSPMHNETLRAMTELSKAAQSMRYLMDYLEQHPEALLRGKK